jgi:hypothetical protein
MKNKKQKRRRRINKKCFKIKRKEKKSRHTLTIKTGIG